MGFSDDIKSRNTNLFPIVIIGDDDPIRISTNSVTVSEAYYKPLLLNVPSLKESIDIEKRNYKISNVTLDISNFPHEGIRFSEMVADSSLMNQEVNIYWVSQSDEKLIYKGQVHRYTHDDEKVRLVVEDRSQLTLHKDLPNSDHNLTDVNVPKKNINKPTPMVYGRVMGSPAIISQSPFTDDENIASIDTILTLDYDERTVIIGDEPLKIFGDDFIDIPRDTKGAESSFYFNGQIQWEDNGSQITFPTGAAIDGGGGGDTATSNNNIIAFRRAFPTEISPKNEDGQQFGAGRYASTNTTVIMRQSYHNFGKLAPIISGTTYNYPDEPLNGESLTVDYMEYQTEQKYSEYNAPATADDLQHYGQYNEENWNQLFFTSKMNVANHSDIIDEKGYVNFFLYFNVFNVSMQTGNNFRYTVRFGGNQGGDWFSVPGQDLPFATIESDNQGEYDNPYTTFFMGSGSNNIEETQYYNAHATWSGSNPSNWRELAFYTKPRGVSGDAQGKFALEVYFPYLYVNHWMVIDKMQEQDYYVDVDGRGGANVNAQTIIHDIMTTELNQDVATLYTEFYNWNYGFTINETINSKKLIEEIASASPFIPRFNHQGEFKIDVIKPIYKVQDFFDARTIEESDCIKWSYSRTKIEDVYSKIEFHYNFNYARDEFDGYFEFNVSESNQFQFFNKDDYFNYYGLKDDHSESTLIIDDHRGKYIRDKNTAERFTKWMLHWHCNQHLKIKVKLPLKYLEIEIGSYLKFDKILGGIEPYGIDYTAFVSPDIDINVSLVWKNMNFSRVFPLFMCISTNKTLEYIEIEAIQLRNLLNSPSLTPGARSFSQFGELPLNYNIDADYSDGSEVYASHFQMTGCPFEIHPSLEEIYHSENYVGEDILSRDNTFTASSFSDPTLLEGGAFYNYIQEKAEEDGWGGLITPSMNPEEPTARLVVASNCEWDGVKEHRALKLTLVNEEGDELFFSIPIPTSGESFTVPIQDTIFHISDFITGSEEDGYESNFDASSETIINVRIDINTAGISLPYFAGEAGVNILAPNGINVLDGQWNTLEPELHGEYYYTAQLSINWLEYFNSVSIDDPTSEYGNFIEIPFTAEIFLNDIIIGDENFVEHEFSFNFRFNWGAPGGTGDMNGDGFWNILDIVALANAVLASDPAGLEQGDMNQDGFINVLDIVALANGVLEGSLGE